MEEFRAPISVLQCYNCKSFGHSAKSCRSKQKCLICGGNHSHKGCLSRESRKPTCVQTVNNQKTYASVVSQNILSQPQKPQTFNFTAEQLTKFVANVVIQIAQPQVCYPNPKEDTLDLKSSMCRKVSNAAKKHLRSRYHWERPV